MSIVVSPDRGLPLALDTTRLQGLAPRLTDLCLRIWLPMTACLTVACMLRAWELDAPFASSDQVAMPHSVRHGYGLTWIFAHSYGPIPAIVQRSSAEIMSWFDVPLGETASRFPIVIISMAQVLLVYPLMLRMRGTRNQAVAASLVCALLPSLVTDAHYAWGYLTIWLFFGSLALWATLAYLDDGEPWQLSMASASLFAHCLSNCFSFGLPLTLLVVWLVRFHRAGAERRQVIEDVVFGFLMPCLAAVGVMTMSWLVGGGPIARLLCKQHAGATGLSLPCMVEWGAAWFTQFGYLFVVPATAGLIYGIVLARKGDRRGLLAVWAVAALLPLVLFSNPTRIGYPGAYLMEAVFTSGILAVVSLGYLYQRLSVVKPILRAAVGCACLLSLVHLGIGSVDACLTGNRLRHWTGVTTGWGSVAPDTGMKAAGWYVRQYVPPDATVLTIHTNRGLEAPVAEYYLGRRVAAGMDHQASYIEPLLESFIGEAHVVVVEPEQQSLMADRPDFVAVFTATFKGQPVRTIYARPEMHLTQMTRESSTINPQYDQFFTPRHIPQPLPAPPDYQATLARYQQALQKAKASQTPATDPLGDTAP
jgi:hypothetical protein